MRTQIAAANWKMNLTFQQGEKLLDDILAAEIKLKDHQKTIFAVPYPYLTMTRSEVAEEKNYYAGFILCGVFVAAPSCTFGYYGNSCK
jgi:triosephosphate isomerase